MRNILGTEITEGCIIVAKRTKVVGRGNETELIKDKAYKVIGVGSAKDKFMPIDFLAKLTPMYRARRGIDFGNIETSNAEVFRYAYKNEVKNAIIRR